MRVTKVACQREILRLITASMLPRDDMFDMKTEPRSQPLGHLAILASVRGALPHQITNRRVHSNRAVCFEKMLRFRLENTEKMIRPNQRIIFRSLRRGE